MQAFLYSNFSYISYFIYFSAILLEYLYTLLKEKNVYQIKDTFVNLCTGIFSFILRNIAGLVVLTFLYNVLQPLKFFSLPSIWVNIITEKEFYFGLCFILIMMDDFCYYMYHRISHISRFWWCIHEVHHSSEKYNFTVYFRASFFEYVFSGIFWIPLILVGFTLEDILIQMGINLFYQFWLHSSQTKRIPVFDYFFNTPSHHRVHHSQNIPYLDRNFGGTFIIWDRIFGTFAKEKGELKFGVLSPPNSYNPFFVSTHLFKGLWNDIKSCPRLMDKIKYLIYPPGWKHDGTGTTSKQLQEKYYESTNTL